MTEQDTELVRLEAFVEGLLNMMDWVGTGSSASGALEEKESRDEWQGIRAALTARLSLSASQGGEVVVVPREPTEALNIADRILRQVRATLAAEDRHFTSTDPLHSRDEADLEYSRLVGFTLSQCDAALAVVRRRVRSLAAPPSPAVEPRVRVLAWEELSSVISEAAAVVGIYRVKFDGTDYVLWLYGSGTLGRYGSREGAKSAAQEHYTNAVLSAIETTRIGE